MIAIAKPSNAPKTTGHHDEAFLDMLPAIERRARENPLYGSYARTIRLPSMTELQSKDLGWVIDYPMPSFRWKSLDESAMAIREFAAVADRSLQAARAGAWLMSKPSSSSA